MAEMKSLLLGLSLFLTTTTFADVPRLQVKDIAFGKEGTRISIEYTDLETPAAILIHINYPGVPRPFSPERDYYQDRNGNTVGFNMKPAVGANEIYLVTQCGGEIRILPRVNNTLQQLLKDQGVEAVSDALYLQQVDSDIISITYEPYGYEDGKPSKTYRFKLRSDSTFGVVQ